MDLQVQTNSSTFYSNTAAAATVGNSPASTRDSKLPLDILSLVAGFSPRRSLSSMTLTSRSWRLAAKRTANYELIKELNLFYAVLTKAVQERLKIEGFSAESFSTETTSLIRGLGLLGSLIDLTVRKEFPLPPTIPFEAHPYTTKNLYQFACYRPRIDLSQKLVGGCLDILTPLKASTLNSLMRLLLETSSTSPSTSQQRTDFLGYSLISGFKKEEDSLEIEITPFTYGLIELALRIKETSPGVFNPEISDAEWIQAELYRLAECIQKQTSIPFEEWRVFYRELLTKNFLPVRLECSFDPEIRGSDSRYNSEDNFKVSLDPALTPFLAVIPPLLRNESLPLPCYAYQSLTFPKADLDLLMEIVACEDTQLNLFVRFDLCVKLLQNLIISPEGQFKATVSLILDLLKYSRDLRLPRQGRRHHFPYQFSEPLNYLEELMVKALNNLPDKADRLKILHKLPHHFGSRTEDSISFLCALASRTREITEQDIEMLQAHSGVVVCAATSN